MNKNHDLFILPDGTISFLYDDDLKMVLDCGEASVKRASNIEPEVTKNGLEWFADLSLSNGPKLGPFDTRQQAIDVEIEWLNKSRVKRNEIQ